MTNVLIVYTTSTGNTQQMALAIAAGAQSVEGTIVSLKEAQEATKDDVRACDALIMGSPMRHRTADSRIKKFIEDVCEQLWLTDEMVGKVGGVFTVGGGYGDCGAGCELAQLGLLGAFAAGGMILVTLPKTTPGFQVAGMHWGPHGRSGGPGMEPIGITEEMKLAGWHHGANVARVAAELRGKNLLALGNVAPSKELLEQFANA
ncbi:flavodoxin domain-containing protein [Scytonema sp. NUACC26]|uniref:flavodoxin domain-containing protein n=1 Tax=Scytonema sp. NUACC26 TaxID=3140176 RepID=UPI0034DBABA6